MDSRPLALHLRSPEMGTRLGAGRRAQFLRFGLADSPPDTRHNQAATASIAQDLTPRRSRRVVMRRGTMPQSARSRLVNIPGVLPGVDVQQLLPRERGQRWPRALIWHWPTP